MSVLGSASRVNSNGISLVPSGSVAGLATWTMKLTRGRGFRAWPSESNRPTSRLTERG